MTEIRERTKRWVAKLLPVFAGIVVVVSGVITLFPAEASWSRVLLVRQRNACTVLDALSAVRYTAEHRKLLKRLSDESRVIRHDPEGYSLWATPRGQYWAPAEDRGHFFVLAEMQLEPYAVDIAAVKKGDIVIDCGAYLGHFTTEALSAGAARVIAVEPGSRQTGCLRRMFANEISTGRVILASEGVWEAEGHLEFQDEASPDASFVRAGVPYTAAGVRKVRMPVTTIDAIVRRFGLQRVDFIKMDIEGSEQQALRGAADTLARFKPKLAIAAYHKPDDPLGIPRQVHAANPGYRMLSAGCRLDLDQIRPLTFYFY
jgi:FkbM family methyltransferase